MKRKVENILVIALIATITGLMGVGAATKIFNSNEVAYENNATGMSADNVQDALDELYEEASRYDSLKNRVLTLENSIGNLQNRLISIQSSYNNLFNSQAYSIDSFPTDYGVTVYAEKRSGVVTVTIRGVTGPDALPTNGGTLVLTTLPEKYRPSSLDTGVSSRVTYVLVHKNYRMQFYVNSAGSVIVGHSRNVATKLDTDYPKNYGLYASMSYVTNK